jgi:hypothetical protein
MSKRVYQAAVTGKTQAGGAVEINVADSLDQWGEAKRHWQVQVTPSATPSAGTLTIGVKTPGAAGYVNLGTTIDMTGAELLVSFDAAASSIRLTPTGFDADKTFSAYLSAV